jgi:hypothetical protein
MELCHYVLYSKKYNKLIYIFGDHHERKWGNNDKHIINNYLKSFVKQSDHFIDIFLEVYAERKLLKASYITDTIETFKDCIPDVKKGENKICLYYNVRVHYTDIRQYTDNDFLSIFGTLYLNFPGGLEDEFIIILQNS